MDIYGRRAGVVCFGFPRDRGESRDFHAIWAGFRGFPGVVWELGLRALGSTAVLCVRETYGLTEMEPPPRQ